MNMKSIAIQRLSSQRLIDTNLKLPGDVVTWLGAVQAQDYTGAKWSLGLRIPNCSDTSVEQAIIDRTILRSWVLRGTLHFITAADIHWLLALVAPRIITGNKRRYRELELDGPTLVRSNDLLTKTLQQAGPLDRKTLLATLEQNGIPTIGQRGAHMLQRASLDGLICQGAMHANNPTFMLLEYFPSKTMGGDEARAELTRRYFTSHGPATLQDFTWWSGLPVAGARAGMDSIQTELIQESMNSQTYWRTISTPPAPDQSQSVHLLPGFDEYILAYKDRSASLDVPHYKRLTPTNGMLPATIVINGRAIGTWKRTFKKGTVLSELNPFTPLSSEEKRNIESAASHLGGFLGMAVVLS